MSGLIADSQTLIDKARVEAAVSSSWWRFCAFKRLYAVD